MGQVELEGAQERALAWQAWSGQSPCWAKRERRLREERGWWKCWWSKQEVEVEAHRH